MSILSLCSIFLALATLKYSHALHHMKRFVVPRQDGATSTPLSIVNQCNDTIYPGIIAQGGSGPDTTGFALQSGGNRTVWVSDDWQGRIWGRTNCSFNAQGTSNSNRPQACQTGDCGGTVLCKIAGQVPVTLAEFTLNGAQSQTFYDISLVDGYNLPMAIIMLPNGVSRLQSLSQATTNPSCIGSVGNLASLPFNPYSSDQQFLGTSSSDPLPFESKNSASAVAQWCPWDLQVSPPSAPGDGVYSYPDGNVNRAVFSPCFSACAKYHTDQYCCTGAYTRNCQPSSYSKAAKSTCPDAYSFADDDQSSTFVIPAGSGFEVVFCPGGRSTNIIAAKGVSAIEHGGSVSATIGSSGS